MPVIAISVTKKVSDYYNSMKKGTRSKHFSNVLERHVRLSSNMEYNGLSYEQLETVIQQREDAINKLQDKITELSDKVRIMEELVPLYKQFFLKLRSIITRNRN